MPDTKLRRVLIRNFPERLYDRLIEMAKMNDRSVEGQARFMFKSLLEDNAIVSEHGDEPISHYKQVIPATDWYYRSDNASREKTKSTIFPLAAWALTYDGKIIGLVTTKDVKTGYPILVSTPQLAGDYLHKEQLTSDELLAVRS